MHSRERPLGGWSDIIDDAASEEEGGFTEDAKTDPHMAVSEELAFDDPPTMRSKMPDFGKKAAEPPKPAKPQQRKLKLPVPGAKPRDEDASAGSPIPKLSFSQLADDEPSAEKTPAPKSEPVAFNSLDLVEKLGEPAPALDAKKKPASWREYKEVIKTVIIGVLLIGGVVAWQLLKEKPPAETEQPKLLVDPTKPQPPQPPQQPQPPVQQPQPQSPITPPLPIAGQQPPDQQQPPPKKAAQPMVSIVSTPPGAMIEINGELYGKTPLIKPIGIAAERLEVKLKLEKYKTWEGPVMASDAGHFNLSVTLEKIGK